MTIVRKYVDELPDDKATYIPKYLFLDTRLTDAARVVFGYSASLVAQGKRADVSDIVAGLRYSRAKTIRMLKLLEETDWVSEVDYDS